ncbi:transcriptional repressor [candidate division KSB1 bacterium]|nr:transcriptional repressor [candidate division KSB1 bacterium]
MRGPWWQDRLNDAGFRLTNPRELVLGILRETDKHLSAEDLYVKALQKNPSIGLTTVYRTLDLFTQIGIAQKFDFGDGKARYELANNPLKKAHHHHMVCLKCKSIIDYSDFMKEELELMKKTEKALSKKHKFKIMYHIIHFYGICNSCREGD